MDSGPTASRRDPERQPDGGDAVARRRLDSAHCAGELLAIVAYITSGDGPLQALTTPGGAVSPWHQRLLLKAAERVDIIDAYLRGRVAFLIAGKDRGYYAPEGELDLAGVVLDTCRAAASVVEALLDARLPSRREFETMSAAALTINPALDAARRPAGPPREP